MKNTGICPKCGSKDVHPALHSNTNNIRPMETICASKVYTTHYVCRACGFVEEWVGADMPFLQKIFGQS